MDGEGDGLPSPSVLDSTSFTSLNFSGKNLEMVIRDLDLKTLEATPPLDLCWDLFCDLDIYQVRKGLLLRGLILKGLLLTGRVITGRVITYWEDYY